MTPARLLVFATLLVILTLAMAPGTTSAPVQAATTHGPRSSDLIIHFYANVTSAYTALKQGQIDIVGAPLPAALYSDAAADSNIVLAPVAKFDMVQFDLNNNCTITEYPATRSPTSYQGFRQALAWLTDKDYLVDQVCGGLAERIDQPIAAPLKAWRNASMWYPHYPYEYDPQTAAATLDMAGFTQGLTPNPDYDPEFPGSVPFLRTYPTGHSKTGQDLDPLIVCVRSDDMRRLAAGRLLYTNMRKLGIPVNAIEGPSPALYDRVMSDGNYHIYTGAWRVGRFPPLTVYGLYGPWIWWPDGQNYVTGVACDGTPNYPWLNQLLDEARYGQSLDDILRAFRRAMGFFTDQCITVPLWSTRSFWAYSRNIVGLVNKEGHGPENNYNFMNAYKADGSPIHYGLAGVPTAMNVMESSAPVDYQCLDRINLYGGMDEPPYFLSTLQAGFVQDWTVGTWDDGIGNTKTKLTKYLRSDATFAEPVTGNRGATVNASHYFFSAWYATQLEEWWYNQFTDVHHIDIVNDFQVDIYFDSYSYWNIYYADGPLLPVDRWLQPPLSYHATDTFVEGTNLTTPGVVNLSGAPIWLDAVTVNDVPLSMFSDYNIVAQNGGASADGKLEIFADLPDGAVVVVDYWQLGSPAGYTPGNLPWQTILEGAGTYYPVDFVPGEGGYLTLERNPHYWMATPPLGELDWTWAWASETPPRQGAFHVDIYDMVMAANAYGSQGTQTPDATWFPAADIAPPGGKVDIYDIVTAAGCYGTSFAAPP